MHTLSIKDLSVATELNQGAMRAVRGGYHAKWVMPHLPQPSSTTTTVSITQDNKQQQNNPTGNGSAVMGYGGSFIGAENNQQAFNAIGPGLPIFG